MKHILLMAFMLLALTSKAQHTIIRKTAIDTPYRQDTGAIFIDVTGTTFSTVTTYITDRNGNVVESHTGEVYTIHNGKPVPMGIYCDTVFYDEGDQLMYSVFSVFINQKLVVRFSGYLERDWVWDAYVDKKYIDLLLQK